MGNAQPNSLDEAPHIMISFSFLDPALVKIDLELREWMVVWAYELILRLAIKYIYMFVH